MTLEEFLTDLSKTDKKWYVAGNGGLRTRVGQKLFCPLTEVCEVKTGYQVGIHDYMNAADHLGIEFLLARRIAVAADSESREPELRIQLLKATGYGELGKDSTGQGT